MQKNRDKKEIKKLSEEDERKLFAFISILLSIFGFLIAFVYKRNDKYVMFYAKQSLILFILCLIVATIDNLFKIIPLIGDIIHGILIILLMIIFIYGIFYSLSGKMKKIPFIGNISKFINL
ncbi:MAG TPA: hypothetical protein P5277_00500 [Candidatus Paceibacterota bacterium]|nr:hypothetical protein [Candidatus Paceibacterota bacterium]